MLVSFEYIRCVALSEDGNLINTFVVDTEQEAFGLAQHYEADGMKLLYWKVQDSVWIGEATG